jgi:tetratricopeptide (TPR) repeat protein
MRIRLLIALACCILLGGMVHAQPGRRGVAAEAQQLAIEGRNLINTGEFDKAVLKFTQATKLMPKSTDYQLGLANAWFFVQDYNKAMAICRPLMTGRAARPEAFQIYGNCQDAKGQAYEALATYRAGLKRFPHAGILFQEMGLVEAGRERYDTALAYWERGIAAEPTLPSNYYVAAERLFAMGDYAWAANYAEIFIVLTRSGEQVRAMSRLLMACYEKARSYDYEQAYRWQFYQAEADSATAYHKLLDEAFASEFTDTGSTISIPALISLRRFVCHWLPAQAPKHPTVPLYRWHQQLVAAGHFEAYHYWLLYDARQEEFMGWLEVEQAAFDAFEDWMLRNALYLSAKNPILRIKTEEKHRP